MDVDELLYKKVKKYSCSSLRRTQQRVHSSMEAGNAGWDVALCVFQGGSSPSLIPTTRITTAS